MSGEGWKTVKARIGTILVQPKLKRGLVFLILFCVLVAVTDWFVLQHLNRSSLRERDAYSEQLSAIETHIREHGITPELNRILSAFPPSMRYHRLYGVFVQEKPRTIPIVDQHGNVVLQEVKEERKAQESLRPIRKSGWEIGAGCLSEGPCILVCAENQNGNRHGG